MLNKTDLKSWVGSDNLSVDYLLDLLLELANGFYTLKELENDVISYKGQNENA